jgi:hypothetical protein
VPFDAYARLQIGKNAPFDAYARLQIGENAPFDAYARLQIGKNAPFDFFTHKQKTVTIIKIDTVFIFIKNLLLLQIIDA